jgi:hypothetical protein
MLIPNYCLTRALSFMVAYSLIVQASPDMMMRKRPVPFASQPTATGPAQRQGYDSYSPSPTTASLISYKNLSCWSDTTARILSGSSAVGSDIDVQCCQSL